MVIGGSGFSKHASTSSRENGKLKRKKSLFKPERSFLNLKGKVSHTEEGEIPSERLSQKERTLLQRKTVKSRKRETSFIWMIAIASLVLFSIFMVNFYVKTTEKERLAQQRIKANATKQQLDLYNYYISSGDDWMISKEYYNAAFQYRLALDMFPTDSVATFRLISASDLNCEVNSRDCGESERLMEAFVTR